MTKPTSSTISSLARRYGLSRSALLYYDRVGLLTPSRRRTNGYREYSKSDEDRLRRIVSFRKTGASISEIRRMLDGDTSGLYHVLERRLEQLNQEIAEQREQQRFILGLLKRKKAQSKVGVMNLDLWVRLLKASGFCQEDMNRWHSAFERTSPDNHHKFLEFLCIPEKEIVRIRKTSRRLITKPQADADHWHTAGTGAYGVDPDNLSPAHIISSGDVGQPDRTKHL